VNGAALVLLMTSFSLGGGNAVVQNVAQSLSATGDWVVSETTSPVDYSPVVVATTRSRQAQEGNAVEFSVYCRGGRTYLVLKGQTISGRAEEHVISYRINGGKPIQAGSGLTQFGGIGFQGDVVSLLRSLPDQGDLAIRLATPASNREEHFSLDGLGVVRDKMASACKWPRTDVKPRT
jgi:hypothetical protein